MLKTLELLRSIVARNASLAERINGEHVRTLAIAAAKSSDVENGNNGGGGSSNNEAQPSSSQLSRSFSLTWQTVLSANSKLAASTLPVLRSAINADSKWPLQASHAWLTLAARS
jgi:hypothetical protein